MLRVGYIFWSESGNAFPQCCQVESFLRCSGPWDPCPCDILASLNWPSPSIGQSIHDDATLMSMPDRPGGRPETSQTHFPHPVRQIHRLKLVRILSRADASRGPQPASRRPANLKKLAVGPIPIEQLLSRAKAGKTGLCWSIFQLYQIFFFASISGNIEKRRIFHWNQQSLFI